MADDALATMICNHCGAWDMYAPTDIAVEDIQMEPEKTITHAKQYFKDKGWETTWGYDLCPDCVGLIPTEVVQHEKGDDSV